MNKLIVALLALGFTLAPSVAEAKEAKEKKPLLAAGLNWVLPGAGYLYNGETPAYVAVPMIAGAVGLTYVENVHQFENGNLSEQDPTAFKVMFGSVIDAYQEAKAINEGIASNAEEGSWESEVAALPLRESRRSRR
jgi:hypothetical protein